MKLEDYCTIALTPAKACALLALFALSLVGISYILQVLYFWKGFDAGWVRNLFDVSLEQNVPTFFSVVLMLCISLTLFLLVVVNAKQERPFTSRWLVLCLGFLYLAYDEGFHVHEDLVGLIRPHLWDGRLGIFYYSWVIPGFFIVTVLLFYFLSFLKYLPSETSRYFTFSASVYLSGSLGMELVGGYFDELYGAQNLIYNSISTVEESLEITGLILFFHALLLYLGQTYKQVRVTLNIGRKG